jgi:GNAT superfamily N-acetyltransferase
MHPAQFAKQFKAGRYLASHFEIGRSKLLARSAGRSYENPKPADRLVLRRHCRVTARCFSRSAGVLCIDTREPLQSLRSSREGSRLIYNIAPLGTRGSLSATSGCLLWNEYQRFYNIELAASVTENTWQRLHNGAHGLGARDSAASCSALCISCSMRTPGRATACYLQDLYVDPRARGTGCGRQLIAAVAESARAAGANHTLLADPREQHGGANALRPRGQEPVHSRLHAPEIAPRPT